MNSSGLPSQLPITMATRIYLSSIILNEAAISSQANNILHIICTPTHICDCHRDILHKYKILAWESF